MNMLFLSALLLFGSGCAGPQPVPAPSPVSSSQEQACRENEECGEGRYCAKPAGKCDEEEGQCRDRPETCIQLYAPVCGCDGKTYSNSCHAAAAGQNVDHEGECREEPEGDLFYGRSAAPSEPAPRAAVPGHEDIRLAGTPASGGMAR